MAVMLVQLFRPWHLLTQVIARGVAVCVYQPAVTQQSVDFVMTDSWLLAINETKTALYPRLLWSYPAS
jgi:hypothetical protein